MKDGTTKEGGEKVAEQEKDQGARKPPEWGTYGVCTLHEPSTRRVAE
jgi:hypothetical protein